ncbi:uncharacterized protein N0V96_005375 [Colletotrichum fioriniae]|uniref:uncharacterized protein n=1 Tax=Colletotrichum fioriniae TaxID=710243 RepID=UPI0032DA9825|nr:hypothetical protein N0V96_005375 [Colletotrichum fioriniae]
MTIRVINAFVEFCKWATAKRPDGSDRRYNKDKCHCFDPVEKAPKKVAEDAVKNAEK